MANAKIRYDGYTEEGKKGSVYQDIPGMVDDASKVVTENYSTQEGATKIDAITLSGASQSTASIPEKRVFVYNASNAIIYVEVGVGATAVTGTSQPLATLTGRYFNKSAISEIAVIGAGAGDVNFSPEVTINV